MNRFKLAAAAMAAAAALAGAPTNARPAFAPGISMFSGWGGGRRQRRGWQSKNEKARQLGIPKAFRQHARRHRSGPEEMAAMHLKFPVPRLDHWRDRREAFTRALLGVKS